VRERERKVQLEREKEKEQEKVRRERREVEKKRKQQEREQHCRTLQSVLEKLEHDFKSQKKYVLLSLPPSLPPFVSEELV